MSPVSGFLRMIRKHPPAPRYYLRALLYFVKLLLWEPFRLHERWRRPAPHARLDKPPIFVLGYYRSGTTHLQELLLQDDRHGYLNFFQCVFSTGFLFTEKWLRPVFERIIRLSGFLHPAHQIPFGFALPAEEDVAMIFRGSDLAANWGQVLPRAFKDIYTRTGLLKGLTEGEEQRLASEMHELFAMTSEANGGKRLVLKSPPQTGRLRLLQQMYPDAKFVFIRRDPYETFRSNQKLWRTFDDQKLQEIPEAEVWEAILWSYDECHKAYERDKALLRPGQLSEVTFEELMAAPVETVERVYGELGLDGFGERRETFERYVRERHRVPRAYAMTPMEEHAVESRLTRWLLAWGYHRNVPRVANARLSA